MPKNISVEHLQWLYTRLNDVILLNHSVNHNLLAINSFKSFATTASKLLTLINSNPKIDEIKKAFNETILIINKQWLEALHKKTNKAILSSYDETEAAKALTPPAERDVIELGRLVSQLTTLKLLNHSLISHISTAISYTSVTAASATTAATAAKLDKKDEKSQRHTYSPHGSSLAPISLSDRNFPWRLIDFKDLDSYLPDPEDMKKLYELFKLRLKKSSSSNSNNLQASDDYTNEVLKHLIVNLLDSNQQLNSKLNGWLELTLKRLNITDSELQKNKNIKNDIRKGLIEYYLTTVFNILSNQYTNDFKIKLTQQNNIIFPSYPLIANFELYKKANLSELLTSIKATLSIVASAPEKPIKKTPNMAINSNKNYALLDQILKSSLEKFFNLYFDRNTIDENKYFQQLLQDPSSLVEQIKSYEQKAQHTHQQDYKAKLFIFSLIVSDTCQANILSNKIKQMMPALLDSDYLIKIKHQRITKLIKKYAESTNFIEVANAKLLEQATSLFITNTDSNQELNKAHLNFEIKLLEIIENANTVTEVFDQITSYLKEYLSKIKELPIMISLAIEEKLKSLVKWCDSEQHTLKLIIELANKKLPISYEHVEWLISKIEDISFWNEHDKKFTNADSNDFKKILLSAQALRDQNSYTNDLATVNQRFAKLATDVGSLVESKNENIAREAGFLVFEINQMASKISVDQKQAKDRYLKKSEIEPPLPLFYASTEHCMMLLNKIKKLNLDNSHKPYHTYLARRLREVKLETPDEALAMLYSDLKRLTQHPPTAVDTQSYKSFYEAVIQFFNDASFYELTFVEKLKIDFLNAKRISEGSKPIIDKKENESSDHPSNIKARDIPLRTYDNYQVIKNSLNDDKVALEQYKGTTRGATIRFLDGFQYPGFNKHLNSLYKIANKITASINMIHFGKDPVSEMQAAADRPLPESINKEITDTIHSIAEDIAIKMLDSKGNLKPELMKLFISDALIQHDDKNENKKMKYNYYKNYASREIIKSAFQEIFAPFSSNYLTMMQKKMDSDKHLSMLSLEIQKISKILYNFKSPENDKIFVKTLSDALMKPNVVKGRRFLLNHYKFLYIESTDADLQKLYLIINNFLNLRLSLSNNPVFKSIDSALDTNEAHLLDIIESLDSPADKLMHILILLKLMKEEHKSAPPSFLTSINFMINDLSATEYSLLNTKHTSSDAKYASSTHGLFKQTPNINLNDKHKISSHLQSLIDLISTYKTDDSSTPIGKEKQKIAIKVREYLTETKKDFDANISSKHSFRDQILNTLIYAIRNLEAAQRSLSSSHFAPSSRDKSIKLNNILVNMKTEFEKNIQPILQKSTPQASIQNTVSSDTKHATPKPK